MNKYCLNPYIIDENNLGGCYYDRDDNWVFIDKNTTKPLTNNYNFIYDVNGELIPIRDRKTVKDNIKSVRIAPNLLTTFYSDYECTNEIASVGGDGLKERGIVADAYGYVDVPNGVNCIKISDEYYNLNSDQPDSNNEDGENGETKKSSSLLWLQILLWILIVLSLILVIIAYYEAWKKSKNFTPDKNKISKENLIPEENVYIEKTYPKYLQEYSSPPLLPSRPVNRYINNLPNVPISTTPQIELNTLPSLREAMDLPLTF